MMQRVCKRCKVEVDDGTKDAVSSGALNGSQDDIPTLCASCNAKTKG